MFFTMGSKNILENLMVLSYATDGQQIGSPGALHLRFGKFLENYQPTVPRPNAFGPAFILDTQIAVRLAAFFKTESILNDRAQSDVIEAQYSPTSDEMEKVAGGYLALAKICPDLKEVFDLVIRSVFFSKSNVAGGGSSSSALGVIWTSPKSKWVPQDYIELLIHELTHNLFFIDECRYKHYKSYKLIAEKENFAFSAILKTSRPLDKVIHSILVATEILKFRDTFAGHNTTTRLHPESRVLLSQTLASLDSAMSLKSISAVVTPRVLTIMEACRKELTTVAASLERQENILSAARA